MYKTNHECKLHTFFFSLSSSTRLDIIQMRELLESVEAAIAAGERVNRISRQYDVSNDCIGTYAK